MNETAGVVRRAPHTACRVGRSLKSNSVRTVTERYTDVGVNQWRGAAVFSFAPPPQFIHMRTCRGCRERYILSLARRTQQKDAKRR
jgi:hypothetical protein